MANEIQEIFAGSQSVPIAWSDLISGEYDLTFGGDAASNMQHSDSAAAVQSLLEGLASIGSGNILVTATATGFTYEFQGALANTDVSVIVLAYEGFAVAVDIDATVDQSGVADTPCVPSINTTTSSVAAANEVQQVDLGGATLPFTLNGNSTFAEVSTLDTAGIQTACDAIWGFGETVVADIGGGLFSITFSGSNVDAVDIPEMTIADAGDGSPLVTTTTSGASPVSQIDTITFDSTAVGGAMVLNGFDCDYNQNASEAGGIDPTVAGATTSATTPSSGSVTITWDDDQAHSPVSVSVGTLISATDGDHDITTISTSDTTNGGSFTLTQGGNSTASIDHNASTATVESAIESMTGGFACTVTGSPGDWTIESDDNRGPVGWTVDVVSTVFKSVTAEIVTTQEGAGAGGGGADSVFNWFFQCGIFQ
jgi:hypothetical protein